MKVRGRLLSMGKFGKQALGLVMLCLGILIATGTDKLLEAWILDKTPEWLTALTTRGTDLSLPWPGCERPLDARPFSR